MGVIYKHTNKIDGHMYIGYSTFSIEKRWKEHLRDCKCVNHKNYNTHFYNALREYGEDAFEHEILEECHTNDLEVLYEREKYWIAYYNTYENRDHYNLTPGGDGGPVSEETRKKMSEAQKGNKNSLGKKRSDETKRKISLANKGNKRSLGRILSEETRQKISEGNKGKILSEETRKKISEGNKGNNNWLGKTHSEETRQKISEAKKGNKNWLGKTHSEESRQKMSEGRKGKPKSEETRKKMSEAQKGKTHSEETRKKISEARKKLGPYKKNTPRK
jgi:group I intron endonuclease